MQPPRILFINDIGFQYGAGIAQARQVQSMLHLGWEVAAIAWEPGGIDASNVMTRPEAPGKWLGMLRVRNLAVGTGISQNAVIEGILTHTARLRPNLIVVGNIHAANWPITLVNALGRLNIPIAVYLHDCYFLTGRCPYPGSCAKYLSGCDSSCPTASEYPAVEPTLIAEQWRLRRTVFSGNHSITVLANSDWTRNLFQSAIPAAPNVQTLYLGADETVFTPGDRTETKRFLGLPEDKPLVLCAAVNFHDTRKGGAILRELIKRTSSHCHFAAFGHNAGEIPGMIPLGYHVDPRDTARITRAADIFVSTALEEAFGQTIVEAQLSGCPVVAFGVGGVPEIVDDGTTGDLVKARDFEQLASSVIALAESPIRRVELGNTARLRASARFSVAAHADRWKQFRESLSSHTKHNAASAVLSGAGNSSLKSPS